jgi:hypothetical protein
MTASAYPTGAFRNCASSLYCTTGMMPLRTAATARYSTVQMMSEAMMPTGRSRLGFLASSAVVDTASNPM